MKQNRNELCRNLPKLRFLAMRLVLSMFLLSFVFQKSFHWKGTLSNEHNVRQFWGMVSSRLLCNLSTVDEFDVRM